MANKLFEPIIIGGLKVPNRIAMAPMSIQYATSTGEVTQRQVDYYAERARNRIGLIIVEAACIAPGGRLALNQINIYHDRYLPGLSQLAAGIKPGGARAFLQIHHAGRRALPKDNDGIQPMAPSPIPVRNGAMPRELTIADIENLIEAFAQGAQRARKAGFDGVEMHFAHSYLIGQFFSPLTNKRTDRYGGDLASRARLGIEIIGRVKQLAGASFPVGVRICGDEFIKGGMGLRETTKLAAMLEAAGADYINVSAGYTASHEEGYLNALVPFSGLPMSFPPGFYLNLAEGIKRAVRVPVIAVGRLSDPILAEEVISSGRADMVALGRGVIADPEWATKVYEGRYEDIRRCLSCNHCVVSVFKNNVSCVINAGTGREAEYRIKPADSPKRVVIVGGGPGGMEAARVAALRGHKVTLIEKKPRLGGNLVPASAVSFKKDINLLAEYLSKAIRKLSVDVHLETEADAERVLALQPQAVILATGAVPLIPDIPGTDRSNVTDAVRVLERKADTGRRVVVAGGGAVGCEAAAFLAQGGKQVTIVEMRETDFSPTGGLAPDMEPSLRRWFLFDLLPGLPIDVIGKSNFCEVTGEGLVVQDREGKRSLVRADTVVFAAGMKPEQRLKSGLESRIAEFYEIGDCVTPGHIVDAVEGAARVARLL